MSTWKYLAAVGMLAVLMQADGARAADDDAWTVAEPNPIVQVYVGRTTDEGRELVFELSSMHFSSNQRLYGCIFVNGRIGYIKEYNNEDSYVRAIVKLDGGEELTAYCGVIKAPENINPHDHAALWRAFTRSPHPPFKAKLGDVPEWRISNPIRDRKVTGKPVAGPAAKGSDYPYLHPEERPAKAKEALSPLTGDSDRFRAVWGLAISGYCPEGAEALATIATDPKQEETLRGYAAMGLSNYSSAMPAELREAIRERLRQALRSETHRAPQSLLRTLIAWGDTESVAAALGERLCGHPMEITVLAAMKGTQQSVDRLLEIHDQAGPLTTHAGWSMRETVGRALVARKDKRGVDFLIECLSLSQPWPAEGDTPQAVASNEASFRQSLKNTFAFVVLTLDEDFGYYGTQDHDSAIAKLKAWWKQHRESFSFDDVQSNTLPAIPSPTPLTKRQARLWAAKLATDAFAAGKATRGDGKPVGPVQIRPESFNEVRQQDGRWVLNIIRSRGPEAWVQFNLDGSNERVEVAYSLR